MGHREADKPPVDDGRPADDFEDTDGTLVGDAYASPPPHSVQPAAPGSSTAPPSQRVPASPARQAQTPFKPDADAHATVVYTDAAGHAPPQDPTAPTGDAGPDADPFGEMDDELDFDTDIDSEEDWEESPKEEAPGDAYTRLLARMNGNVKATEALIEAERERTPAVARPRLIENALLRLEYGQKS